MTSCPGLTPPPLNSRPWPENDAYPDVIRAGSFASVNQLVRDITAYLAQRNADPKPYVWKAEGAESLAKIKRPRAALEQVTAP